MHWAFEIGYPKIHKKHLWSEFVYCIFVGRQCKIASNERKNVFIEIHIRTGTIISIMKLYCPLTKYYHNHSFIILYNCERNEHVCIYIECEREHTLTTSNNRWINYFSLRVLLTILYRISLLPCHFRLSFSSTLFLSPSVVDIVSISHVFGFGAVWRCSVYYLMWKFGRSLIMNT